MVVTEIFGRSPSSEATKNIHNASEAGLTLSSSGTRKGENLGGGGDLGNRTSNQDCSIV